MSITNYKRLLATTVVLLLLSLGYVWNIAWKYFNIRTEARAAWSTMMDYETTRRSMRSWGTKEDAAYLNIYAQSSSKYGNQSLGLIMDHEKKIILEDIIADLRKKTGKDLGDDPVPWINMFAHQTSQQSYLIQGVR